MRLTMHIKKLDESWDNPCYVFEANRNANIDIKGINKIVENCLALGYSLRFSPEKIFYKSHQENISFEHDGKSYQIADEFSVVYEVVKIEEAAHIMRVLVVGGNIEGLE